MLLAFDRPSWRAAGPPEQTLFDPERTHTRVGSAHDQSPDPFDDRPGEIGRFLVIRPIGQGGMGRVFEAHDPELERRVAIKILLHGPHRRDAHLRLRREAQMLARVSHPRVVAAYEIGESEHGPYLTMAYVPGCSLRTWMNAGLHRRPHAQRATLGVLLDAGRALEATHAVGVVHRDFKPSNVLIAPDGRALLADFGLARLCTGDDPGGPATALEASSSQAERDLEITGSGSVAGTPAYMAHERKTGVDLDHRSDQFSFCVVAWELLFGVHPFDTDDPRVRLERIKAGRLSKPSCTGVSPPLEAVLRRGLAYRQSKRHPDMTTLLRRIEDALGQAHRPSHGARDGRQA